MAVRNGPTVNAADYNSLGSIGSTLAGLSAAVQTAYGAQSPEYLQAGYLTPQAYNNAMYDQDQARNQDATISRVNEFMTGIQSPDKAIQQQTALTNPDLYNAYATLNAPQTSFKVESAGGRLFQNEYDRQGKIVNSQDITDTPQGQATLQQYQTEHTQTQKTPTPWVNAGNGWVLNNETGETHRIEGYESPTDRAKAEKAQTKKDEFSRRGNTMTQNANDTLSVINSISNGELDAVSGWESRFPTFRASTTNTEQKFKQLGSRAFMDNVQKMRGMGSLSNAEGGKIAAASSALFDDEGNLKSGMSQGFIQSQLDQMKASAIRLREIGKFYQANGREPNAQEYQAISDGVVNQLRGGSGGGNGNAGAPVKIGRFTVSEVR